MIEQAGITVAHNTARSTTTLIDSENNHCFELDHGSVPTTPDEAERAMLRAYVLGGTIGLLGCFGAERIRPCQ
jgi:hypothetical protein